MSPRPAPRKSSLTGTSPLTPPPPAQDTAAMAARVDQSSDAPQATQDAPTTPPAVATTKATRTAAEDITSAQGVPLETVAAYLTRAEFQDAKAAYLADWRAGGEADTHGRWIADALDAHAARTPAQRATLARPVVRGAGGMSPRSWQIPADVVARMMQAIVADQDADRWPSRSSWAADAIAAATEAARTRDGGTLPTPPPRLPNRLQRA